MLKIFNDLEPFFWQSYEKISVREYARLKKISPPSASTLLKNYAKEGLLIVEEERRYLFFYVNRENLVFVKLSGAYFTNYFEKIGMISDIKAKFVNPTIVIFGSFSKAEVTNTSDLDIAIFSSVKSTVNLSVYEKKLQRPLQIFAFKNRAEIKNPNLLNNILKGVVVYGSWYDGL